MVLKKLKYNILLALVPMLYSIVSRVLFASCRVTIHGDQHYQHVQQSGESFIASFWHYTLFYTMHIANRHKMVAMVSASDDAEFVSRFLNRLGVETVRGSRSRGGVRALKQMVSIIKDKKRCGAIVADGSQGPPREAQGGVVLLASKTGVPILPVTWSADRYWVFKSWDRTVLPKPFARLALYYGEPLSVPAGVKSKDVEQYRLELEHRMNGIYQNAWAEFGVGDH